MKEVFIPYKPHASTLVMVEQANTKKLLRKKAT